MSCVSSTTDDCERTNEAIAAGGATPSSLRIGVSIPNQRAQGDDGMSNNERARSDEPMVADSDKAGAAEQTGGTGTGTQGSSNIAGQNDSAEATGELRTPELAADERSSR